MLLGNALTPDHLRLMFTPDFGMFIAPGCNGIRGSVTMGFIALIAGYVYRFRWYANALVVSGAILLGYAFNLARLCLLVLYYVVALHLPSLQNKAENADYLIGAGLFLIATLLLFMVIHWLRDGEKPILPETAVEPDRTGLRESIPRMQYARMAALGLTALVGCTGLARANAAIHPFTVAAVDGADVRFPQRVGNYTLARTWNEALDTGPIVYVWGQYLPADGGTPIAIGISPVLGWHDPFICHSIRGDHPLWQGPLAAATAEDTLVNFNSALYNDGVTQSVEASTMCRAGACGEFATERTHFGFIYTHPDPKALLSEDPTRPTRVLLRAETIGTAMPPDVARKELTQNLRTFLASVNLRDLTRSYGE
jgi:exosortase J